MRKIRRQWLRRGGEEERDTIGIVAEAGDDDRVSLLIFS